MENLINNTITYTFDIKIAKEYGVNEAIFISNMKYWIFKNIANNKNYFDGKHWTYNSKRAFLEIFPFWTEQTLKTTIKHLVERGVLVIGNYNKNPYDRTNWYAFVDETMWIDCNYPIDRLKLTNGEVNTNQPIPNNKPNNKPNKKEIDKEKQYLLFNELINKYPNLKEPMDRWLKYKKEKKENYTDIGLEDCIEKLNRLSGGDKNLAMDIVKQSTSNNWSGLFPLKDNYKKQPQMIIPKDMSIYDVDKDPFEV